MKMRKIKIKINKICSSYAKIRLKKKNLMKVKS